MYRIPSLKPLMAALALAGSAVLSAPPARAWQQPAVPWQMYQRQISVNGIARMDLTPDAVDLTMTIIITRKGPKSAAVRAAKKRNKLIVALTRAGVPRAQLSFGRSDLSPVHGRYDKSNIIINYRATETVVARLRAFSRLHEIMECAADLGVNRMHTRYLNTEMTIMKKKVRRLALEAARDKAKQMAGVMKVSLGRVLMISESQTYNPGRWALGNTYVGPRAVHSGIRPGAIPLSLTVSVKFEIK